MLTDKLIVEFDKALRTVATRATSYRPHPDTNIAEADLNSREKKHVAALMRINHTGEVCAQALYHGQALTSRNPETVRALHQASLEETEHLAWCEQRIHALGGRKSLLNPVWYVGSLMIGVTAGALGDQWNLGFLAETERQVGKHLQGHLDQLPKQDAKTKAILEQMYLDETKHADMAVQQGGVSLPAPVKGLMAWMSKVMTSTVYRI